MDVVGSRSNDGSESNIHGANRPSIVPGPVSDPPSQPVLHEIEFRLSYGDCDPAGIVYFAAYYPWFDRTYNEWAFLGGFPPG